MTKEGQWDDRRVEIAIGYLLRTGVAVAAVVTLIGGIIHLIHNGTHPANFRVFQGEPSDLRHVRGILRETRALRGRGIIQLGLVLLIATPVARVAFSMFGFALERDRMYIAFTGIVLAILLYSLLGYS